MKLFRVSLMCALMGLLFTTYPASAKPKAKTSLLGQTVQYQYSGAKEVYKVKFSARGEACYAHWHVLSGASKGQNRKEEADCAEVAPGVWFVSWVEPTHEVVNLVLNLEQKTVTCGYYDGKRYFWKGKILSMKAK